MYRRQRNSEDEKMTVQAVPVCSACGAAAERVFANYCPVCGKTLVDEYQPLDSLRSSNRMQGRAFLVENRKRITPEDLFAVNRNSISETAWASCVYSMVPYIGIVFIPFTLVAAFLGVAVALRSEAAGGTRLSAASFGLSFVILGIQVFLWWLLYVIPELAGVH